MNGPPPEPLTEPQADELAITLKALKSELESVLDDTSDNARPVDLGLPIGRLSRMDAMQQQSMAKAGRAAYQRRLAQVQQALASVADGEYGYCKDCAEPIGYQRLSVRPEAPFCVACQERLEAR